MKTGMRRMRACMAFLIMGGFLHVCPVVADGLEIQKGVEAYQDERFEDAVDVFQRVLKENPDSTPVAFLLGLALKQVQNHERAEVHLRHAVTGEPRIREALVELILVLFRQQKPEKVEEALAWIDLAEREDVYPAGIAFLKGQILQFQQRNSDAIAAFNHAKTLDPEMTAAADVQIRLCEIQEERPDLALACFRASILHDPGSDPTVFLAGLHPAEDAHRPAGSRFGFRLGLYGRYDANVLLKPLDSDFAANITDEKSPAAAFTIRSSWRSGIDAPRGIAIQHLLYGTFHEFHDDTHDYLGNALYLTPGIRTGRYRLALDAAYHHVLLRGPDYAVYHQSFRVGPLLRAMVGRGRLLEWFGGYEIRKYHRDTADPGNDRSGQGLRTHVGWSRAFGPDAWMNLRLAYAENDADGRYWANDRYEAAWNGAVPVSERLHLRLGAEVAFQQHRHKSPDPAIIDDFLYLNETRREDRIWQGTIAMTWRLTTHFDLTAQYNHTWARSTHAAYDYRRALYTAGVEWGF